MKALNFYSRPFHQAKYGTWVYDSRSNFCFEFDKSVTKEIRQQIIFRLNALNKETEEIPEYDLTYHPENQVIKNRGEKLIEIRGWGNLTGIGGHRFDGNKAGKIQDDLAEWLIERLNGKVHTFTMENESSITFNPDKEVISCVVLSEKGFGELNHESHEKAMIIGTPRKTGKTSHNL